MPNRRAPCLPEADRQFKFVFRGLQTNRFDGAISGLNVELDGGLQRGRNQRSSPWISLPSSITAAGLIL